MNELNLCKILKGHEGETFYCSLIGDDVKFKCITESFIVLIKRNKAKIKLWKNGGFCSNGECQLFPSKDQRDWNKWVEEQNNKTPKTWSELVEDDRIVEYNLEATYKTCPNSTSYTPVEKAALALLKIHQLIEVRYGGNVTSDEWHSEIDIYYIHPGVYGKFYVDYTNLYGNIRHIAFHTKEQAEEFLKYPENVQLLKDYFMI